MRHFLLLLSLLLLPALVFGGTAGKISGKIVDQETGDPLPGANVTIQGTSLGAAANVNGDYVILNVPVGAYIVKASFIGYHQIEITNVRVTVDLTTNLDFSLPAEAIEVSEISIVAERPLVNKNATNQMKITTAEDIKNLPIRGYHQVVSLSAGAVTTDNGNVYVRGGRVEETAYYIDGVYQNSLRTGGRSGRLSSDAVEEVSVQTGGFNAEYGFANSGVVNATTKTGGSSYHLYGEVITDEFLSQSNKRLGTFSYGYNIGNASLGGPVPGLGDRVRFFGSIEGNNFADRTPSIGTHPELEWGLSQRSVSVVAPDELDIVRAVQGPIPGNSLDRLMFNGNLTVDLRPIRFKIGYNSTDTDWTDVFTNTIEGPAFFSHTMERILFDSEHFSTWKSFSRSFFVKATHTLGNNTFYGIQFNLFADGTENYDPTLGSDIQNYGDKTDWNKDGVSNPALRDNGLNVRRHGNTANLFDPAGVIYNDYQINRSDYWGTKGDITHQAGKSHELKAGFEYRRYTMKRYRIADPMELASTFTNTPDIKKEVAYAGAFTDAYGYNLVQDPGRQGNFTSDKLSKFDDAKHPELFAVYIQDKIEVSDLVLNLGLRLDSFAANDWVFKDIRNILLTNDGLLDRSQLEPSKRNTTISPRLGAAFPISEKTVFYGQFGKFTQQPPLRRLYVGWENFANYLRSGNYVNAQNPNLRSPKTTSYEIGIRQQVGDNAALDLSAYYKETRDLILLNNLTDARPTPYSIFDNGDFATTKGLAVNFNLRRTNRVAANLSYTLQFAGGTGSVGTSQFYIGWLNGDSPTSVNPTSFDQRHSGSLNVDVLFNESDGILDNTDLNMLFTFGSGFPYTPKNVGDDILGATFNTAFPRGPINSANGPWQAQLDMRLTRAITLAGVDMDVFLWAVNILNVRNVDTQNIYGATGDNADNGYLDSPEGQAWIVANGGARAADLYRAAMDTPDRWSVPRQLRLGFRFDLD